MINVDFLICLSGPCIVVDMVMEK